MGLEEGTDATVAQLLDGLLTVSANDAAVALGETLSGSRETFVEQMNAEARRLGLEATSLRNLTGESALGQRSSAADLARLTARLQQAFPEESLRFRQRELNWRGTRQENPNRLLWLDPSIEGLFLSGAELRGAGFIGSAQRGTRRMVAVVLGAPNAVAAMREALKLLNHGFQAFDGVRLYAPGESVAQVPVTRGNRAQARLGFSQGLLLSLPVDFQGRLQPRLHTRQPLRAPLSAGDPAGSLSLTLDDQLLGEFPVQVLEDVPEAALPGRVWDDVTDWLKSGNRPPAREDAR
ncbi:MAG: peptidase [Candidatus Dactylopiibacterium carminicum]|uniref:serine-type D-Ala-D-Ala carboxypeptidase n=2 Tax=Candidatus Dactylopiibacterium carminicum TaxID=857335 RepID=A0A272EWQ6_9RHOO|nr:D-alanyl-D-alanine carboxypeptidase [Candidatus Dactylopiibacterium carminicum]PAS94544.1 MAG: peptidase [Candidatus Dactylopiibacterium carminicum]PAT00069.1 MAG: hypothetical protein BSR46_04855 [Candidatus Dactylopiibacterium carminicum]